MKSVLFIPKEEIIKHFSNNDRQDIKIIVPSILSNRLFERLIKTGKNVKPEMILEGDTWVYSKKDDANFVCESKEIGNDISAVSDGPFCVSFANHNAEQDKHYHEKHIEIYYSDYCIEAEYKDLHDKRLERIKLEKGGMIIFGSFVVHKMLLSGLTVIIEIPAVENDKKSI